MSDKQRMRYATHSAIAAVGFALGLVALVALCVFAVAGRLW